MDYLLIGLVAVLSFLVGYFICQKRFKNNSKENFSPINENLKLQNNFAQYGSINKQLISENMPLEGFENNHEKQSINHEPNMPKEESETQRLQKMVDLTGDEEMKNIKTFEQNLESYNDTNHAYIN